MSESTPIRLPISAPFPVTISSILCKPGESIPKHKTIFKYKYWDYQDDPNSKEDNPLKIRVERIGTFESPIEGEIQQINISIDEEVGHSGTELCIIKEPCTHAVQYAGLCALCGKAVKDEKDYTGYDYEDRASISMSHDHTGLKVSIDEAAKVEKSTAERLTQEKKLILVVDLDQTVIHATVDPTVGEWQSDSTNPNYPAVKDVKSFCLEEEPIVPPGWTGPRIAPTKCWYYVKLRPGLQEFLQEISKLYELHIYTMATRNYALAIAKIIDPTREYFGDRILSRDESGSLTHKNLKRLFPVDRSMVAIIDDRGDVWQWENNLIKVVPYDFFVGIGDINSSFLPKKNGQLMGPIKKRKSIAKLEQSLTPEPEGESEEILSSDATSPLERILELGGGEGNTNLLLEQSITRNQSIEKQQHNRPLAKLQKDLQKMHHEHEISDSGDESMEKEDDENLLYDDDNELFSLKKVLIFIHSEYYRVLKEVQSKSFSWKPDLIRIIPSLKSKCLEGITILFSGIIQLGIAPETADIVIWSKQFGVKVVTEVTPEVTHVICREPGMGSGLTFKVRAAKILLPGVKIVNPDWLFSCLSTWSKVDETEYLIKGTPDDWIVNSKDIKRYQDALQSQREKANQTSEISLDEPVVEYDLADADQEVDDFLAGISDDENDDGYNDNEVVDNGDDGEDGDDENEDDLRSTKPAKVFDSFIRNAYNLQKRQRESESEDEEVDRQKFKKLKAKSDNEEKDLDLDELEKELLDGFDDLEES